MYAPTSNDKISSTNNCCENARYARNSSGNLKKLVQVMENETKRDDILGGCKNQHSNSFEIAQELSEEKRQRFLEQKRRQQIRENSQELKELETKLRNAYISKGLAAQLADRQLLLAQQKEKQTLENELLERARISHLENEKKKEQNQKETKLQLMDALKSQIDSHEQQKMLKIEEYKEEQQTIDEVVKRIWKEQYEEQRNKIEKRMKLLHEAEAHMKIQQMIKAANHAAVNEEEKAIAALTKRKEEREKRDKEAKLALLKEKEALSAIIGQKICSEMQEKTKRLNVLEDLLIEEKAAREEVLELNQNIEQQRKNYRHKIELSAMIENNKHRVKENLEREEQYNRELLAELSHQNHLAKLKEEEQKQKMLQHKDAIRNDLDNKIKQRAKQLTSLLKEKENEDKERQREQQLIEEERIRLLQEHVSALKGYLPAGILRETDKQYLPLP